MVVCCLKVPSEIIYKRCSLVTSTAPASVGTWHKKLTRSKTGSLGAVLGQDLCGFCWSVKRLEREYWPEEPIPCHTRATLQRSESIIKLHSRQSKRDLLLYDLKKYVSTGFANSGLCNKYEFRTTSIQEYGGLYMNDSCSVIGMIVPRSGRNSVSSLQLTRSCDSCQHGFAL